MIHLTKTKTLFPVSRDNFDALRNKFERNHCVLLNQFIESGLLHSLQDEIERARFYERLHLHGGDPPPIDLCMENNGVSGLLYLMLNDSQLFEAVQKITGCSRIGCFSGAMYRLVPGLHYDSWHDDIHPDNRLVAISINFSSGTYSGGVLQIRDKKSRTLLHEVSNTGIGDAILFRISSDIEHRVTKIEGHVSRTAYAGWFQSQPEFLSMLKNVRRISPASESLSP